MCWSRLSTTREGVHTAEAAYMFRRVMPSAATESIRGVRRIVFPMQLRSP
ncbi:hypothetical protein [Flindersiella endophytica]